MSIATLFSRLTGNRPGKSGETISYDALFKGKAKHPADHAASKSNFLPGLRNIENDVDAYFKDVFAGPVF